MRPLRALRPGDGLFPDEHSTAYPTRRARAIVPQRRRPIHLQRPARGPFRLTEVPAIGYTVPYAIGNILLTAWGPVLVALMSRTG